MSITGMKNHMAKVHKRVKVQENKKPDDSSFGGEGTHKRGPSSSIFNMCAKKRRTELFNSTINDWVDSRSKLKFESEKHKRLTKSLFEMLVIDLLPWHTVHKPGMTDNARLSGDFDLVNTILHWLSQKVWHAIISFPTGFLRHHIITTPNYDVPSEKHFRHMLDPTYNKVKAKLLEKIQNDDPPVVSAELDAWSAQHHGYMGINVHYLHDWDRVTFTLRCAPFDIAHTSENIAQVLEESLEDWGLIIQAMGSLCMRDNAPNMVHVFHPTVSCLSSAGCLNHKLQLVIEHSIFAMKSVANLIKKCHSLVTRANHSTQFMAELYKQQEKQMNNYERLSLKGDVSTR